MPVIGLSFHSIEAKRNRDTKVQGQEIRVNSTPKVVNVKEVDMPSLGKKALSLDFEFAIEYSPPIGEIKITGDMLYMADTNAKILAEWKKKKSIPEKVSIEVLNQLFRKCLLKTATIAEDLQLPPPLQMPTVRPASEKKESQSDYVG
jgi:hypothetical protein